MQYKLSCAMESGASRLNLGQLCPGRVVSRRGEGVAALVLADGAERRSDAAEAVTRALSDLLCSRFDQLFQAEEDRVRRLVRQQCLDALAPLGYSGNTMACSLLFFAADAQGRCITGHLGGGVILMISPALDNLWTLSRPEREPSLRLLRGPLHASGAMLLMNDGAVDCLSQLETGAPAKICLTMGQWLRDGKEEDIHKALRYHLQKPSRPTEDDLCLGLVVWGQNLPHPHKETKEPFQNP